MCWDICFTNGGLIIRIHLTIVIKICIFDIAGNLATKLRSTFIDIILALEKAQ